MYNFSFAELAAAGAVFVALIIALIVTIARSKKREKELQLGIEKAKKKGKKTVNNLTDQCALLLLIFDAWITRIKMDYENRGRSDSSGAQHMSWGGPYAGDVFTAERVLQDHLNNATSRHQKVAAFASELPELVRLILMTYNEFQELSPSDQRRYLAVMAKVRMYFPVLPNGKVFPDHILIGDPPYHDL